MAEFGRNLGRAFVSISPDVSEFVAELGPKVNAAAKAVHPKVRVEAEIDTKAVNATVVAMLARLKPLIETLGRLKFDADSTPLTAKLSKAQAQAVVLAKQLSGMKADVDVASLLKAEAALLGMEATTESLYATMTKIGDAPVFGPMTRQMDTLHKQVAVLVTDLHDIQIDANDLPMKAKLSALIAEALALRKAFAGAGPGGDAAEMARMTAQADKLTASVGKFRDLLVKPVAMPATKELADLQRRAGDLAGRLGTMRIAVKDAEAVAKLDHLRLQAERLQRELADTTIGGDPVKMAAATAALSALIAGTQKFAAESEHAGSIWAKIVRITAISGGGFGLMGLLRTTIGGIAAWHIVLDALLETVIAVTGALIALTAAVAALAKSAEEVGLHLNAVQTVSGALHQSIYPLTGAFADLQRQMAPRTIELFGGALGIVHRESGTLLQVIEPVVHMLQVWTVQIGAWTAQQNGFAGAISHGSVYLQQFGDIVGYLTDAIHTLLTKDPGIAEYLGKIIVAGAHLVDLFSKLPAPVVETALALHAIYLWGVVFGAILGKLLSPIGHLVGWIFRLGEAAKVTGAVTGMSGAVGGLGAALGRAGAGLKTFGAGLLALATNPFVWIGAALVGLGFLIYKLHQASDGAKEFIGTIDESLKTMKASDAFFVIGGYIGALDSRIQGLKDSTAGAGHSIQESFKLAGHAFNQVSYSLNKGDVKQGLVEIGKSAYYMFRGLMGWSSVSPAVEAAGRDIGAYRGEIIKLTGEQTNYFKLAGQLIPQFGSLHRALAIMDLAGVKATDSFATMSAEVKNLIDGYKAMSIQGPILSKSVDAVTFASLQQQSRVEELNQAWDTFFKTITGGESAFTSFASQTIGLYSYLADGGAKLNISNGKLSLSTRGVTEANKGASVSMTGLNAASLQARETFLRSADAANTQMDSLTLLASAAGLGAKGTSMLQQANKDMVASLLPAAQHSKVMTDILYALAQRGGYEGANSFQELSKWAGKTKDPMKDLDGIVTTLTTAAAGLTEDVKNLSIAIGRDLNDAMGKAVLQASGGQKVFDDFATAVFSGHKSAKELIPYAQRLAQAIYNTTGNVKDAHDQFVSFATTALHMTRGEAEALWKQVDSKLKPVLNDLAQKDVVATRKAFDDLAGKQGTQGLGLTKDKADALWVQLTTKLGPDLNGLISNAAVNTKDKFVKFAMEGLNLSHDKAVLLWTTLRDEKLTEAGRKASITQGQFEKMAGAFGISKTNADNLRAALTQLPANTVLKVSMNGDGTFNVKGTDGSTWKISAGGLLSPHAQGGFISGGIPGKDSVGALLMPGEVVVPTAMVQAGEVDHLRGRLPGFGAGGAVRRFEAGGTTGNMPPPLDPGFHATMYGNVPRYGGVEVTPHGAAGMLVRALAKGGMITGGAVKGGLDGTWGLTPDYVNKTYQGFLSVMANSVENFVRAGVNTANAQARLLAGPAQGQSILSYAGKFAGKVPYVWGGSSPVSGWDCSGFVSYVYNKFGLYNGRTTAAGFQNWARSSAAVPGGLVFFGNPAHHVGFVVNGKTMLSALGRQWGTLYSSLAGNSGYGIPPSWAAQMRGISGGIGFAAGPSATGSAAAAQNLARSILWAYGWGQNQWPYLQRLWQQESSWSAYAVNRSSGAYGIPQALPSVWDHPYALGDYANQVRWGLAYISGRYPGGPAEAWAHEVANNWYGRGGQVLPHGMATGGTVGQFRDKLGREQASELKSYAEVARHRHQGGFTRTTYSELDTLAKRQAAEVLAYREATGRGLSDQTLRHFLAMVHAEQRTAGDKGLQKLSGIGKLKQDLADLNRIGGNPPAIPDKIAPPPPPAWKVPGHLTLKDWWKYLRAHQAHEISDYRALRRSFEHDIAHAPLNSWIHRNRATLRSELGTLAKRQEREQHAFDEIAFRGPGANKKTLAALRAAIKTELHTTGDKALSHWPEGHLGRIYGLRHWLYALDKLASMAVPPSTEKVRPPLVPPAPQARVLAGEFSFDRGGTLKPGWNLAYNGLGRDEDLVPAGGGGGDIHVHLHNEGVIGSRAELDNWLSVSVDRLARQGRLTYALRRSFSAS